MKKQESITIPFRLLLKHLVKLLKSKTHVTWVYFLFIYVLFTVQYYSVYDLVKDVPERDIDDDLTDDSDSDTDDDHVFGDPKVLWENMPPEHKIIVKEMFDTVNKQVEQAKYAERYNIPLGK